MIFIVLVLAGFFLNSESSIVSGVNGALVKTNTNTVSDDVQIVKMYVEGSQYVFEKAHL